MMHKSSITIVFLFGLSAVIVLCFTAIRYQYSNTQADLQVKRDWVKLVQLPDLSLTTAAGFIRHRSLAYPNQIFYAGPEVRDYFPSAFTYRPSPMIPRE